MDESRASKGGIRETIGRNAAPGLRRRKHRRATSADHITSHVLHQVAGALKDTSQKLIGNTPEGMMPLDRPLYPWQGGQQAMQANIREMRYTMLFWTILGACMFFYWAGIPLHDTQIPNGYPRYSINAPGNFYSNRYGFEWALCYMLWFNFLPIVLTPVAISQMNLLSRADVHYALSGLVFISNTFVFLSLLVIWGFFINTESTVDSMGSDPKACGLYWSGTKGTRFCPNVIDCPGLTRSDLHRSGPFFQHFLFSLLFNAWLFYILYQNQRVRTYGGWSLSVSDTIEYAAPPSPSDGGADYETPPSAPPKESYDL